MQVVGVARRVELIEEQAERLSGESGKLYPRKCDLRDERQINAMFDWVEANLGAISIMVNNAGLTLPTTLIGLVLILKNVILVFLLKNSFQRALLINGALCWT